MRCTEAIGSSTRAAERNPFRRIYWVLYDEQIVRSIWVFLARSLFAAEPAFDTIGFSWISLDSLVRIETYQWVTLDFSLTEFSRALCLNRRTELVASPCESQTCSCGELNLVSDFAQLIVAPTVPFPLSPGTAARKDARLLDGLWGQVR